MAVGRTNLAGRGEKGSTSSVLDMLDLFELLDIHMALSVRQLDL